MIICSNVELPPFIDKEELSKYKIICQKDTSPIHKLIKSFFLSIIRFGLMPTVKVLTLLAIKFPLLSTISALEFCLIYSIFFGCNLRFKDPK